MPDPKVQDPVAPSPSASAPAPAAGTGNPTPAPAASASPAGDNIEGEELISITGDTKPKVDAAAPAGVVAPESYQAYTLPEGVSLDTGFVERFNVLAKRDGFDQGKAQEYVGLAAEYLKQNAQAAAAEELEIKKEWGRQISADPEFGGKNLKETVERANYVLSKEAGFADDELRSLFETGTSNHPAMIKFLARIDKALGEHKIVGDGGTPPVNTESPAEIMFPGYNKK